MCAFLPEAEATGTQERGRGSNVSGTWKTAIVLSFRPMNPIIQNDQGISTPKIENFY